MYLIFLYNLAFNIKNSYHGEFNFLEILKQAKI